MTPAASGNKNAPVASNGAKRGGKPHVKRGVKYFGFRVPGQRIAGAGRTSELVVSE